MGLAETFVVGVGMDGPLASSSDAAPAVASADRKRRKKSIDRQGPPVDVFPDEPVNVRRWDAAMTDRLNESHWQYAHGNSINVDLASDRETLLARIAYEIANNPMVEGVVNTWTDDVIGKDGPRLQIQSDDEQFNELVEHHVARVLESPDPVRGSHGVDVLATCVRQFWTCGEYLLDVIDTPRPGPVTVGFRAYHPRRLKTPPIRTGGTRIAFGIEFSDEQVPLQYWIRDKEDTGEGYFLESFDNYRPVSADSIQHVFRRLEPEQIRGVPWLAPALPAIADLRQLDKHVMEAAKNSAAQSLYWYTNHPDAELYQPAESETHKIETGTSTIGPPGWQPATLNATQPSAQYKEFRHERLRELGRPANMPMMTVLLSSADSNFASAHYDGQVYSRSIDCVHGMMERASLNPLVEQVITELVLSGLVTRPAKYTKVWKWKKPPHADPKKMADQARTRLEDGTASLEDVLEPFDQTFEEVARQRAREHALLETLGLPLPPVNHGRGAGGGAPDQADDVSDGAGSSGSGSDGAGGGEVQEMATNS